MLSHQTQEPAHGLSIVSDDGSVLKSFGGRRVGDVGNINFLSYFTVDRSDNILVADRDNGRVLMLNSRRELTVELLTKKDQLLRVHLFYCCMRQIIDWLWPNTTTQLEMNKF